MAQRRPPLNLWGGQQSPCGLRSKTWLPWRTHSCVPCRDSSRHGATRSPRASTRAGVRPSGSL